MAGQEDGDTLEMVFSLHCDKRNPKCLRHDSQTALVLSYCFLLAADPVVGLEIPGRGGGERDASRLVRGTTWSRTLPLKTVCLPSPLDRTFVFFFVEAVLFLNSAKVDQEGKCF